MRVYCWAVDLIAKLWRCWWKWWQQNFWKRWLLQAQNHALQCTGLRYGKPYGLYMVSLPAEKKKMGKKYWQNTIKMTDKLFKCYSLLFPESLVVTRHILWLHFLHFCGHIIGVCVFTSNMFALVIRQLRGREKGGRAQKNKRRKCERSTLTHKEWWTYEKDYDKAVQRGWLKNKKC